MEFEELTSILEERLENLNSIDSLKDLIESYDRFLIFGAGGNGKIAKEILESRFGKKVVGFLDSSPSKWGKDLDGVTILPPDHLRKVKGDRVCILISSLWFVEIYEQLMEYGFRFMENCSVFFYWLISGRYPDYGRGFAEYFLDKMDGFRKTYSLLEDEESKEVYLKLIKYRALMLNLELLTSKELPCPPWFFSELLSLESPYEKNVPSEVPGWLRSLVMHTLRIDRYQSGVLDIKKKKTVIDGGAYIGDTACAFCCINPDCRVYAFEPLDESYARLEEAARFFPHVVPLRAALWRCEERLCFEFDAEDPESARVTGSSSSSGVEGISIDGFCSREGIVPDFIKLDVEGAEWEVIKGAEGVICEVKPDWAISIYHSSEDLWRIPVKMHELGYKVFIRHRDPSILETICFAVG